MPGFKNLEAAVGRNRFSKFTEMFCVRVAKGSSDQADSVTELPL